LKERPIMRHVVVSFRYLYYETSVNQVGSTRHHGVSYKTPT